jgi:uncharacterized PurR-regulated membrane protein YhhQ (DUF165 family)
MTRTTWAAVAAYITSITAANLLVAEYGPRVTIINAFALIGLDLVLRDYLHDQWRSPSRMAALIAAAGVISYAANPATGRIALASCAAFTVAALVDWAVYAAARRQPWLVRSNVSNVAGSAVDSLLFPTLAFGVVLWPIVLGQFVAKIVGGLVWSVVLTPTRAPRAVADHN